MSNTAIKIESLSKKYRLGTIGYGTLKEDLRSWWALARGKEDPNTQIGDKSRMSLSGEFWALKDLDFEIKQGDRVGIIGRNGAGKSTLLKIISRITAPTTGNIKIKGRVASLLEVGTGFHGELTGRENIHLNGAILGMKRYEINRKMDEIIAFSEIDQYIDTPVKRYSSGMYVRLAFAVAAHLDSDILIADEVLAVGDAAFQKKAIGKMQDLSTGQGRTVLFVSHQMSAVQSLCNTGIILEKGQIQYQADDIHSLINTYLYSGLSEEEGVSEWINKGEVITKEFNPLKIKIHNTGSDTLKKPVNASDDISIRLEFETDNAMSGNLTFELHFYHESGTKVFSTSPYFSIEDYKPKNGYNKIECIIPKNILNKGRYTVELQASIHNSKWLLQPGNNSPILFLTIDNLETHYPHSISTKSIIFPRIEWK